MSSRFTRIPIKLRIAIVCFVLLVVVTIAMGAWRSFYASNNPIVIRKVPGDARIYINNSEIKGSRTKLEYGKYEMRTEAEGFTTNISTLVVDANTTYLAVGLLPESDEAKKWAQENQNDYLDLESFVYDEEQKAGASFSAKNPIVKLLPIDNYSSKVGYTIDQSDVSGQSIILTIYGVDGYRNSAIKSIIEAGYDPADYKYSIQDEYTNPFEVDNE